MLKKWWLSVGVLALLLAGCWEVTVQEDALNTEEVVDEYAALAFDAENYETKTLSLNWEDIIVRAYENIVYVLNPVDTTYEIMNIYVPEQYYSWEEINWFTIETAPIFFPNKVGWYMPWSPETLWWNESSWIGDIEKSSDYDQFLEEIQSSWEQPQWKNNFWWETPEWTWSWDNHFFQWMQWGRGWMGGMRWNSDSVSLYALAKWYVVASAWARWRTTQNEEWKYTWKAPAWIIDLKAAIRYLKYNDASIPWDSNKIISNGTSAWWAMSALIWATANHPDYEQYLQELWAAPATDDVFAVSSYCPITNLDNADKAYEWEFYGVDSFSKISAEQLDYSADRSETESTSVSDEDLVIAKALKDAFTFYINTLSLVDDSGTPFALDSDWEWNFKEAIKTMIIESFNKALTDWEDLSSYSWLDIEESTVVDIDFDEYVKNYLSRNKGIPAFDWLSLENGENNLFGDEDTNNRHFTNFWAEHSLVSWAQAPAEVVKLMNPMNYIPDSQTTISKYWRIRHWAKDADTSLAIPFILAKALEQRWKAEVDFSYPWDQGHGWDYDPEELLEWMDSISH